MERRSDLGGSETLAPEAPSPPASPAGGPVLDWDRYELLGLLGQGGMGEVYRARDRRLDRLVAIKVIVGADPTLTLRLVREARAQARIAHPNVCRVHEVGEVGGRAYIALQLVDGEPLQVAATQMSLEDKASVMRDVANAIQEAHRLGIVHRDLKPANVMVERAEDGRWVPIVMDFGLARETMAEAGLTRSGALLGTPSYMSPEQARGEVHAVDRRSDIYGLGATFYELLTGRPPFADPSLAQLLAQVIHDAPPPPRRLVPSVPADLEIVVLKCLAKDPAQRYPSARALAEDLGRYLDGEPILGRGPSRWQRLRTYARRHRALVTLGAWSLAALVVVATLGVRAWIASRSERARTAARTVLAQQLGQDAKDIELFLRTAYQLPLQDMRIEREVVRARMRLIAVSLHDLGDTGDAVMHDALGRGHLALHEWQEAADELARAADAGLHSAELHAARGRALGELYDRALREARRSGDPTWLAGRQRELEAQYLTPALAELAQSRGAGDSAALLDALIALYRRDLAAAERGALAAAAHAPWLFEARRIAADAAYSAAVEAFDHGKYDAARPALERAATLYGQASDVARSDASIYEAAAQTWLQRAELDFRQGRSPRDPLDHAIEAIDRALLVDPDDAQAYTTKAYVLLRWYQTPALSSSGDQRPLLERIAQTATRATELDRHDANAWDALGNAHVYRGTYESYHGGQGGPWWNRAIDELGHALAIRPSDPWVNNDIGVVHRWLGTDLENSGHDPIPEYRAALRGYERATVLDPSYVYAWSNQVDLYAVIAEHLTEGGIDPRTAVAAAEHAGAQCLTVDASFYSALNSMAEAQISLASYLAANNEAPTTVLAQARDELARADGLQPDNMTTWFYRLVAAEVEAGFLLRQGGDPTSSLVVGRVALKATLQLNPGYAGSYVEAARLDLIEAASVTRAGLPSGTLLAKARADTDKAVALDGDLADAKLVAAEVCLQLARSHRTQETIDRGISYIGEVFARKPWLIEARTVRAGLARL